MCGICGVYNCTGGRDDRERVTRMMDSMRHRGPDGQGSYISMRCGIGHRRLAVIDLSDKGRQPMSSEDGKIQMVVNGEIYNYKEMRDVLLRRGHRFSSDSDSEVIVHGYEEYGTNVVSKLRGMFALAVYDARTELIMLARDPVGEKPLYYTYLDGSLLFASEVKALLAGGISYRVNYDVVPQYLIYQYVPGGNTLFKSVRKLLPGHMLLQRGNRATIAHKYWPTPDKEYARELVGIPPPLLLREKLDESVKLRLQSDVPVGVFLSGGVDSSAVAALYRKMTGGVIHTLTASFGGISSSEIPYAHAVSDHLGTTQHDVEITAQEVAYEIDRITFCHDDPLGDAATICNYFLAKEAKNYVTVVLAGEGGDELFGGYPWYKFTRYHRLAGALPKTVRALGRHALRAVDAGNPTKGRRYVLGRTGMFLGQDDTASRILYPTTTTSTLTLDWLLKYGYDVRGEAVGIAGDWSRYSGLLAADFLNLLPEKFLMKADKGTMAWAVEERLPLLDREVVSLAFSLPDELKRDKWVLRESVSDLLPREIVWRKKQGFGTPVAKWLTSKELLPRVVHCLHDGDLLNELCQPQALSDLAEYVLRCSNSGGKVSLSPTGIIWNLFALQIWHDVWSKQ